MNDTAATHHADWHVTQEYRQQLDDTTMAMLCMNIPLFTD